MKNSIVSWASSINKMPRLNYGSFLQEWNSIEAEQIVYQVRTNTSITE